MSVNTNEVGIRDYYWAVFPVLICAIILFTCSILYLTTDMREYLYSSDVGSMFIMAGIVAESLKLVGVTNASESSIVSYAMITQLGFMLITALSACLVLLGAIKGKRKTFFSYDMVIIGSFSASKGSLAGNELTDFMMIVS